MLQRAVTLAVGPDLADSRHPVERVDQGGHRNRRGDDHAEHDEEQDEGHAATAPIGARGLAGGRLAGPQSGTPGVSAMGTP